MATKLLICRDVPMPHAISRACSAIAINMEGCSGTAIFIGWHNFGLTREFHRRFPTKAKEYRSMIMLINNLIALLPNARDEVYQTRWMLHRGINPLPAWTVNWFYELLDLVQGRSR
jgi:hypothetical protein